MAQLASGKEDKVLDMLTNYSGTRGQIDKIGIIGFVGEATSPTVIDGASTITWEDEGSMSADVVFNVSADTRVTGVVLFNSSDLVSAGVYSYADVYYTYSLPSDSYYYANSGTFTVKSLVFELTSPYIVSTKQLNINDMLTNYTTTRGQLDAIGILGYISGSSSIELLDTVAVITWETVKSFTTDVIFDILSGDSVESVCLFNSDDKIQSTGAYLPEDRYINFGVTVDTYQNDGKFTVTSLALGMS